MLPSHGPLPPPRTPLRGYPGSHLQQFVELLLEAVSQQIHELATGKVHPAEEGELGVAEQAEGVSSSLEHRGLCVLHHHLLQLLQQQLQVLRGKGTRWCCRGRVGGQLSWKGGEGEVKKEGSQNYTSGVHYLRKERFTEFFWNPGL